MEPTSSPPRAVRTRADALPVARDPSMRRALSVQSWTSAAVGLAMATGAAPLAPWLALPEALLLGAGVMLIAWSVCLGWLRAQAVAPRDALRLVVGLNLLWALDAALLLAIGPLQPTTAGTALVASQALLALGFAAAQHRAMRRAEPAGEGAGR